MEFEEAIKLIDSYEYVIEFIPQYVPERQYVNGYEWKRIKDCISQGYASNMTKYNSDYEFIKDWFSVIAWCLNRLNLKNDIDLINTVKAMKTLMDYYESLKMVSNLLQ